MKKVRLMIAATIAGIVLPGMATWAKKVKPEDFKTSATVVSTVLQNELVQGSTESVYVITVDSGNSEYTVQSFSLFKPGLYHIRFVRRHVIGRFGMKIGTEMPWLPGKYIEEMGFLVFDKKNRPQAVWWPIVGERLLPKSTTQRRTAKH